MICHCFAVTDTRIRELARSRRGTGGKPLSLREVVRACGAGRGCGGCRAGLQQILAQEDTPDTRPVAPDPASVAAAAL